MWQVPNDGAGNGTLIIDDYRWPQEPEVGKTYDWGYVFATAPPSKVDLDLKFSRQGTSGGDTMYIGVAKKEPVVLSPVPNDYHLFLEATPSGQPSISHTETNLVWATRRSAWDSSFGTYGGQVAFRANRIFVPTYSCDLGHTSPMEIKF